MTAVAVREVAMCGGLEADYLLLINGKAAAVLEAKREEISLSNPHLIACRELHEASEALVPDVALPLPFVYLSNGRRSPSRIAASRTRNTKSLRSSRVRGI